MENAFDGCIKQLRVGTHHSKPINWSKDVLEASNVKDCSLLSHAGCAEMPCLNGGHCLALANDEYTCDCIEGYE